MPARREIHTGRYNFLHRSWGPLEPFDDSMPEILKENGIHSHLISDHYHYWEEGGCNYHTKYSTWEIVRGQEGDPWKGVVEPGEFPVNANAWGSTRSGMQDWINRRYMHGENHPQKKTFSKGLDFIDTNHESDDWFLQIETFDPHEPYFSDSKYKLIIGDDYNGPVFDWPAYGRNNYTEQQSRHCRHEYAALVRMCDEQLGLVLDAMDKYRMWEDTMLIVNTDHGFLLGEHDFWGKCKMPFYNEVAHTPFFIWDPRAGKQGIEKDCLVQTIDIAPTLLDYFDIHIPKDMQGYSLASVIKDDKAVRRAGLFGMFGGHVNCTDGRYVYMRAPSGSNENLYEYTHMPCHMKHTFIVEELQDIELSGPFEFTKGCRLMKIPGRPFQGSGILEFETMLFDVKSDPYQKQPIENSEIEELMKEKMVELMRQNDTPAEQFERLGFITTAIS